MPKIPAEENFKQLIRRYLKQVEYVHNISEEAPFFPQHVHIEPTNACNLQCIHCHHHATVTGKKSITRPFGMMDLAVYRKVIDEIVPLNCSITLDLQGEPTLHPKIIDMVSYAKSQGLFTSLLTNATRLTDELIHALLQLKLDRIVFSFDAVDQELYERIRLKAQFQPTLRNLLNFIRCNCEEGHHTHICVSVILQERTAEHIETYKRFFHRLPVDKIFVSNLLNLSGGSGVSREIDMDRLHQGSPQSWPICRVPWENIVVNWDGEVTVCPLDYNVFYPIGNIAHTSLQDMWNNDRMRQFRRAHLTKEYRLVEGNGPLCGSCNCLWDPEYDMRRFLDFAVEAIYRNAIHFAHQFVNRSTSENTLPLYTEKEKFENLLAELEKITEK